MDLGVKRSSNSEWLTPHKISLLILIKEACRKYDEDEEEDWTREVVKTNRRHLQLLIPQLTRAADMGLQSLAVKLEHQDTDLRKLLLTRLDELVQGGISTLGEFIQSLEELFTEQVAALHKTSLFGLFVRRMVLSFNKLSLSQLSRFMSILRQYVEPCKTALSNMHSGDGDVSMDISLSSFELDNTQTQQTQETKSLSGSFSLSSKQAEYFLTRQAALLDSCESAALPPRELQAKLDELIQAVPDMAGAHYVSYLNNLRVGEFNGALSSLYHYYDCKQWDDNEQTVIVHAEETDLERCRRFRYAALNLAALHCVFNHREEGLAALNEAIQMSQATNDPVCLEHSLGWLYRLEREDSLQARDLLERFVSRATELNLPYLNSLALLLKVKKSISSGDSPKSVLQTLGKIDVINFQKSITSLMSTTLCEHAAMWELYGRSKLASVYDQCLLHHTPTADANRVSEWVSDPVSFICPSNTQIQNSEATCISLCHLAKHHADHGMFSAAMSIVQYMESVYPLHSRLAPIWILCREKLLYDRAVQTGDWTSAEKAIHNMSTVDSLESRYRDGLLLAHKGHYTEAHDKLQLVMEAVREGGYNFQSNKTVKVELESNILLALCDLSLKTGNFSPALIYALNCLRICQEHFMESQVSLVSLYITSIQLQVGLPEKALSLVTQVMVHILAHSSLYVQCCAKLLLAECQLAVTSSVSEHRKSVLLSVLPSLNAASNGFCQLESHRKIRDVLYYQAQVYNELEYHTERNKCAKECRQKLEQFHFVDHVGQSVL